MVLAAIENDFEIQDYLIKKKNEIDGKHTLAFVDEKTPNFHKTSLIILAQITNRMTNISQ